LIHDPLLIADDHAIVRQGLRLIVSARKASSSSVKGKGPQALKMLREKPEASTWSARHLHAGQERVGSRSGSPMSFARRRHHAHQRRRRVRRAGGAAGQRATCAADAPAELVKAIRPSRPGAIHQLVLAEELANHE
jgi:hypothetical protein